MAPTVGVLALQGGFDAHRRALERLGVDVRLVRTPADFQPVDALVIPGGESTTMLTLAGADGLGALGRFVRERPVFGTCAGAILLARHVDDPQQGALGALDISIRRNAYGRQVQSSVRIGWLGDSPFEMVFIRAPRIVRVGPGVEILGTESGDPVLVREGRVLAATFHPELGEDLRVHRLFLEMIASPADRPPRLHPSETSR